MIKIFNKEYWKYIFAKKSSDISWFKVIWCRFRDHPYPFVWYNLHCDEPDMRCSNCYDDCSRD